MTPDTSPLSMGQRQELLMFLLPRLLDFVHSRGLQVRGKELQRTQAQADANAAAGVGISHSLHLDCLAIDLQLFRDGEWLNRTEDHAEFGAYWKTLHPLCRWGGDFKPPTKPDGNHYSIAYQGRA